MSSDGMCFVCHKHLRNSFLGDTETLMCEECQEEMKENTKNIIDKLNNIDYGQPVSSEDIKNAIEKVPIICKDHTS